MKEKLSQSGGTGLQILISGVLFGALDHVVVYPVADEKSLKDGEGKVLPDAFVVPNGIEAKAITRCILIR